VQVVARGFIPKCAAALTLLPVVHAAFGAGENKDKTQAQGLRRSFLFTN